MKLDDLQAILEAAIEKHPECALYAKANHADNFNLWACSLACDALVDTLLADVNNKTNLQQWSAVVESARDPMASGGFHAYRVPLIRDATKSVWSRVRQTVGAP